MKDKTRKLIDILSLVDEAEKILLDEDKSLNEFGRLLDTTWKLKKSTGDKVSTNSIDELYDIAIKAGALGGKLLGAGSGGFLLFYCEKEKQCELMRALDKLMIVPFNFESDGTQILYYSPQEYSPRKEIVLR